MQLTQVGTDEKIAVRREDIVLVRQSGSVVIIHVRGGFSFEVNETYELMQILHDDSLNV